MIRVYRYGLLPPVENADIAQQQISLAHRYRNDLVEIERGRRAAIRAIYAEYGDVAALTTALKEEDTRVAEASKAIKSVRAATRQRSETAPMRLELQAARIARKAAAKALSDYRAVLRKEPAAQIAIDAINERANELQRSARANCGVFWGTYLLVEAAHQKSRSIPLYDGSGPNDPRFVRWNGEGHIGVQIQGGMPVPEAFGGDTRIQIVDGPRPRCKHRNHKEEDCRPQKHLRVRVGSNNRAPVWVTFPMIYGVRTGSAMPKDLPKEGRIKWASVNLRMIGPREEWSVCITVEETAQKLPPAAPANAIAIDIGWRKLGNELRVGSWEGSDGVSGEIRLDADMLASLTKADSLRSIRDHALDTAKILLGTWLAQHEVPQWLRHKTTTLAAWRSQARLSALVVQWKKERFNGDDDALLGLCWWQQQDRHLWEWETSQRTKSLRRRRDFYRVFAAWVAARYGTLVLEQFDLRKMARRATIEGDSENDTARANRVLAALFELRLCLSQAATSRGRIEARMPAENTTRECSICHQIDIFDAAAILVPTCSRCGEKMDQDVRARRNLLARWRERPGDAQIVGRARKSEDGNDSEEIVESKWVKAKRGAHEKKMRMEGAREVEANYAE